MAYVNELADTRHENIMLHPQRHARRVDLTRNAIHEALQSINEADGVKSSAVGAGVSTSSLDNACRALQTVASGIRGSATDAQAASLRSAYSVVQSAIRHLQSAVDAAAAARYRAPAPAPSPAYGSSANSQLGKRRNEDAADALESAWAQAKKESAYERQEREAAERERNKAQDRAAAAEAELARLRREADAARSLASDAAATAAREAAARRKSDAALLAAEQERAREREWRRREEEAEDEEDDYDADTYKYRAGGGASVYSYDSYGSGPKKAASGGYSSSSYPSVGSSSAALCPIDWRDSDYPSHYEWPRPKIVKGPWRGPLCDVEGCGGPMVSFGPGGARSSSTYYSTPAFCKEHHPSRCTATKPNGDRCLQMALKDDPDYRCKMHQ